MSGIVFMESAQREETVEFYQEQLGAKQWLEQEGGCTICKYDNMLFGFCDGSDPDQEIVLTFVTDDREGVDALYDTLEDRAHEPPAENDQFGIYQFFADDPEGRTVEVQTFLHETPDV
jgi:hypothetical protein